MGRAGASVSEFLYWMFGFPSFLIPFFLGIFAFGFIFRWEWKYLPLKCAGWFVILLAASSLFGLWMKSLPIHHQSFLAGGIIGFMFSKGLIKYFNLPGATILLMVAFIVSFVLGTGISFIAVIRRLGNGVNRIARENRDTEDGPKRAGQEGKEIDQAGNRG